MKKDNHEILERRKSQIEECLKRKNWTEQQEPMLKPANIVLEMSDRDRGVGCGGIGAIHTLVTKLKLSEAINRKVKVLKAHLPYFESDHVLNIAYNVMSGGNVLEDIKQLRNDEAYLDALSAQRIPDATTAGDFLRRFDEQTILDLQEAVNESRKKVWAGQEESFKQEAIIDADGTIAKTLGNCKQGMDISYKGIWGYAPLIISLANTNEVLYLVNRPGNHVSAMGAAEWMDRAIDLAAGTFKKVMLRGDTDFSLTTNFDRWDERGVKFVFGYDAMPNLKRIVEDLPETAWKEMVRPARYEVKTRERNKPENVKEAKIKERQYKNIRLKSESIAEFDYNPPRWCKKMYRMVVLRKNLSVERGERRLFDEIRYFFYITNDWKKSTEQIVEASNKRCNQENLIAQLNEVSAMKMPSSDLMSNWAYMVMAALAWNLKAWFAMMIQDKQASKETLRMEFKRFARSLLWIPCQVIRTSRRLVYRILSYNHNLKVFLETFEYIKRFKFV